MKDIALMFLYISKNIIYLIGVITTAILISIEIVGGEIKVRIGKENKENKENNNG